MESADLNAVGVLQLREWCKQALRYMATPAVPEEGLLKECILTGECCNCFIACSTLRAKLTGSAGPF